MATTSTPPEEYIRIFKSEVLHEQTKAANRLASEGYSSNLIFDQIEQNTISYLPVSDQDSVIPYISSQVRALGYSGNSKYRPTILLVSKDAKSRAVRKHADRALQELDEYATLNKIISPVQWPNHPMLSVEDRLLNMISSNDPKLQLMAAMQLFNSNRFSDEALAAANNTILNIYLRDLSKDEIDSIAWLCKILAKSNSLKYKETVQAVAQRSTNKKLRKYAAGYLENLYQ